MKQPNIPLDIAKAVLAGDSSLLAAKCRALIVGYDRVFHDSPYEPVAVEQLSAAQLVNPDTGKPSRTYRASGILDVVARYGTKMVLIDHKTTSQDITDPSDSFWRQLAIEGQISHYMLLEFQNGRKIDEAVWDVMRKPSISPKKITAAEQRSVVATRKYFDVPLSMESLDALQLEPRETTEMYEARLVRDCTITRPEWYFQRRTIPRLDSELLEYARELWEIGQEILHVHNTGRNTRNSGACMLYGSPCKFLGLCSGYDTPDSDKWRIKEFVHSEFRNWQGWGTDGRDIITNSRCRCFQTCRRKHYYEYDLGIERVDEEEREALLFGTMWHSVLEAYWTSFLKGDDNGNGNADSPGIELGQSNASQAGDAC